MPIKPGKDEKQDAWMHRCVPEMMGQNGGTKRPQEQAVAACLTMWRDAHPSAPPPPKKGLTKQSEDDELPDVDPPDDDESKDDFLDRCVDQLTSDGNIDEDEATDRCEMMWEDRALKGGRRKAKDDDDKKKPEGEYGDVEYADPGYQEDKKPRYPIDTETHIRAAWNYINKPENQKPYTADQVAKIKSRIVAAWKKKIDAAGPPSADDKKQQQLTQPAGLKPPQEGEDYNTFLNRCKPEMMKQPDWDEERAQDYCATIYEEHQVPGQPQGLRDGPRIVQKTHAESVEGMEFVLSDETPDRMGDVISAGGWDLTNFKRNPVALFNHRADWPIGKWRHLRVEGKALRGHLVLAPEGTSPRIDEIRRLIDAGILRAVSVGFRSLKSEPLDPNKKPSAIDMLMGGGGMRFLKQELVETSLVSVPANPNALAVAKSLRISPATLDLVFAKSGSNSEVVVRRAHPGKSAVTLHRERTTMTTTEHIEGPLGRRITDANERLVGLKDQLAEHLKNVADDNVSDADLVKTQELNHRIAQADRTLQSLVESERSLAISSTNNRVQELEDANGDANGNGRSGGLVVHGARPFALPSRKVKPIEYMWRTLCVEVKHLADGRKRPIAEIMEATYPNDEVTRTLHGIITRAASAPGTITQPGWALELVTQVWMDFIEALLPYSVYPEIARRGSAFTFGRNGVINLPMRNSTPQISGSFVGEGAPIPVRQGSFANVQLTPKKLAVISTFTRELAEHSTPAIEGIIREAIQHDTAIALDNVLLDNNPATAVRPPGLLYGTVGLTPTAGGNILALIGDINNLIGALSVSTLGNIRNPVWLVSPSVNYQIALTPTAVEGQLPFRDEVSRGSLMGIPIVKSSSVPAGYMILMDCADYATVTEAAPRFDVSDQAVLHMEDTTPLAIIGGTGASPVPAVPTRSLWQTDTIGVRMILPMNWVMRRPGMVQWVTGMTW